MTTAVLNTANALGDFVLCWPILRSLHPSPTLVCPSEKAALARISLSLPTRSIHVPPWNALLQGTGGQPIEGVARVISIGSLPAASRAALARHAPHLSIVETPAPLDRLLALEWAGRLGVPCTAPLAGDPSGPITLHVGSGGRTKRWPLDRWLTLGQELGHLPTRLVAGEVEIEQWTPHEQAGFLRAGGVFIRDLVALADCLRASRLVVAADCGPGHLAAALGVPTLSLFGPTDPGCWAPVGPAVRVLAPPTLRPMDWLKAETVAATVGSLHDLVDR